MAIINKIEKHLDNIDTMKEGIKKDIENLFKKLNVKNFISESTNTVDILIFAITEQITKKYIKPIFKESKRYVNSVIKGDKKL